MTPMSPGEPMDWATSSTYVLHPSAVNASDKIIAQPNHFSTDTNSIMYPAPSAESLRLHHITTVMGAPVSILPPAQAGVPGWHTLGVVSLSSGLVHSLTGKVNSIFSTDPMPLPESYFDLMRNDSQSALLKKRALDPLEQQQRDTFILRYQRERAQRAKKAAPAASLHPKLTRLSQAQREDPEPLRHTIEVVAASLVASKREELAENARNMQEMYTQMLNPGATHRQEMEKFDDGVRVYAPADARLEEDDHRQQMEPATDTKSHREEEEGRFAENDSVNLHTPAHAVERMGGPPTGADASSRVISPAMLKASNGMPPDGAKISDEGRLAEMTSPAAGASFEATSAGSDSTGTFTLEPSSPVEERSVGQPAEEPSDEYLTAVNQRLEDAAFGTVIDDDTIDADIEDTDIADDVEDTASDEKAGGDTDADAGDEGIQQCLQAAYDDAIATEALVAATGDALIIDGELQNELQTGSPETKMKMTIMEGPANEPACIAPDFENPVSRAAHDKAEQGSVPHPAIADNNMRGHAVQHETILFEDSTAHTQNHSIHSGAMPAMPSSTTERVIEDTFVEAPPMEADVGYTVSEDLANEYASIQADRPAIADEAARGGGLCDEAIEMIHEYRVAFVGRARKVEIKAPSVEDPADKDAHGRTGSKDSVEMYVAPPAMEDAVMHFGPGTMVVNGDMEGKSISPNPYMAVVEEIASNIDAGSAKDEAVETEDRHTDIRYASSHAGSHGLPDPSPATHPAPVASPSVAPSVAGSLAKRDAKAAAREAHEAMIDSMVAPITPHPRLQYNTDEYLWNDLKWRATTHPMLQAATEDTLQRLEQSVNTALDEVLNVSGLMGDRGVQGLPLPMQDSILCVPRVTAMARQTRDPDMFKVGAYALMSLAISLRAYTAAYSTFESVGAVPGPPGAKPCPDQICWAIWYGPDGWRVQEGFYIAFDAWRLAYRIVGVTYGSSQWKDNGAWIRRLGAWDDL